LQYLDGIPVLTLAGSPEEIGRQAGTLVLPSIQPLLGSAQELLRAQGLSAAWPVVRLASRAMLANAPKDYRTELTAIVEAVGPAEELEDLLIVANAMIELRRLGGCSALIIEDARTAGDGPLFGRNMDLDPLGFLHNYSLVAIVRPDGKHAFASIGFPGLIGVASGINDAGLAVATLDVYDTKDGSSRFSPAGCPLAFTFRQVLEECTTVAEAERVLRAAPRGTWMNLAVCDREHAAVFELTPKSVVARDAQQHILACTNHFRSDELATNTECRRYAQLMKGGDLEQIDLAALAGLMDSANQGEYTIQTMVFEPKSCTLHVAFGTPPTSALPLKRIELSPLFGNETKGSQR
jgi:predicted choloylglycine hydrolase